MWSAFPLKRSLVAKKTETCPRVHLDLTAYDRGDAHGCCSSLDPRAPLATTLRWAKPALGLHQRASKKCESGSQNPDTYRCRHHVAHSVGCSRQRGDADVGGRRWRPHRRRRRAWRGWWQPCNSPSSCITWESNWVATDSTSHRKMQRQCLAILQAAHSMPEGHTGYHFYCKSREQSGCTLAPAEQRMLRHKYSCQHYRPKT